MLFPEEDAPLLKAWIVKRIEDTSDADAEVLAEYIIALLKHEGTKEEVRKLCEGEIPDFLTEDPKAFLDDVFQAIAYKSYVPGAPPPPKLPPAGVPSQPAASGGNGAGAYDPNGGVGARPPQGPRKRGYHDLDAPGGQEGYVNGQRPIKNPRRQGRGRGRVEEMQPGEFPPMAMPPYDPDNPMAAFMGMGMPYPGMPQFPGPAGRGGRQRKRGRCRDFDNKGFCARGSSCMFDHGNENNNGYMPQMGRAEDEYDPDNAVITLSSPHNQAAPFGFGGRETNRGRGNRRGGRGGKKSGARAPFSAEGPVNDRSKSTIVVENIPEEHFSEDEVRGFFAQFGNIVEISMQPYKHLAIVKYEKWGSANAAYRSPKVIFDNRFVKVFWYKDDSDGLPPSVPNGSAMNGQATSEHMDVEPEMDPEEFQRKQEEAQKQHQERESKRGELERQRQELEKKQQELMDKHREETQRLQSKLLEKNGSNGGGDTSTGATGTDMLRAKLAILEQEAKILGIDPDAAATDDASPYPSRGGLRGRGGFRGRGRGSFRGGRGNFRDVDGRHAAYAQYSLDNRPKRLAITGVDFSSPEKDESLRHFLLNLGEFESVDRSATTTYVSFRDRKTAEKLYHSLHGKELPGVEGKLDLQWVNTPPASATAVTSTAQSSKGEDDAMDGDGDDAGPAQEAPLEMEYSEQRAEDEDAY